MSSPRFGYLLAALTFCLPNSYCQQRPVDLRPASRKIHLNVTVATRSGQWVEDLRESDIEIYDNGKSQTIIRFKNICLHPDVPHTPFPLRPVSGTSNLVDVADVFCKYEITYKAPNDYKSNEYHRTEVRVFRPNLEVKTVDGYYARPQSSSSD